MNLIKEIEKHLSPISEFYVAHKLGTLNTKEANKLIQDISPILEVKIPREQYKALEKITAIVNKTYIDSSILWHPEKDEYFIDQSIEYFTKYDLWLIDITFLKDMRSPLFNAYASIIHPFITIFSPYDLEGMGMGDNIDMQLEAYGQEEDEEEPCYCDDRGNSGDGRNDFEIVKKQTAILYRKMKRAKKMSYEKALELIHIDIEQGNKRYINFDRMVDCLRNPTPILEVLNHRLNSAREREDNYNIPAIIVYYDTPSSDIFLSNLSEEWSGCGEYMYPTDHKTITKEDKEPIGLNPMMCKFEEIHGYIRTKTDSNCL